MKKEARKLSLNRETLAPMQSDDLANVNGGLAPTIITGAISITRSSVACSAATAAVSSAVTHTLGMAFETRWCSARPQPK